MYVFKKNTYWFNPFLFFTFRFFFPFIGHVDISQFLFPWYLELFGIVIYRKKEKKFGLLRINKFRLLLYVFVIDPSNFLSLFIFCLCFFCTSIYIHWVPIWWLIIIYMLCATVMDYYFRYIDVCFVNGSGNRTVFFPLSPINTQILSNEKRSFYL